MKAYHAFLNELVNRPTVEVNEGTSIPWISYGEAIRKEEEREQIIAAFSQQVHWDFKGTKPWINSLSEGCRRCGEGEWSCLFITGKCNARCFYCPTAQDSDDLPTTQQLTFEDPEQYASYLNEFQFRGSSFSGGEPLLVPDRVMTFLSTIRQKVRTDPYIWMYTNGILADREQFKSMADLGLNEVRFDIGATGYSLNAVQKAAGVIPVITVEIPAVPEKADVLKKLLPEMVRMGVSHLNLHQLRLTPYNARHLLQRRYTYLHGERPTVVESELAALDLIRTVDEHSLGIGVNYCGFQYKQRFQKAGFRRKTACRALPGKRITESGYAVTLYGTDQHLDPGQRISMLQIRDQMHKRDLVEMDPEKWEEGSKLFRSLIFHFEGSSLAPEGTFSNAKTVKAGEVFSFTTAPTTYPVIVPREKATSLRKLLDSEGSHIPADPDLFRIWKYWFIESGLRPYF
ncbi:MAG: radical SAM protein [Bacteroidales bacterium]